MNTMYVIVIAIAAFMAYILLVGGMDDVRENLILVIFALIVGAFIAINIKSVGSAVRMA